jgi:dipeptidyl aminopeptidase/acylaminoacyl peptidase
MPRRISSVFFLSLPLLLITPLSAQSFTLQQVLSAPFNSELEASPSGNRVLWIANEEGRRNLWMAERTQSGFAAKRVTSYETDDGLEISGAHWTPDGKTIVYVRGGDSEFPGREAPNPALLTEGTDEEIYLIATEADAKPRKLTEGHEPAISPDGTTLAFLRKGQIYTLAFKDTAAKPVQLIHGRGDLGSLRWSPDSRKIAFVSERGDHGFIGVYSFVEKTLLYLDPSTQVDAEPSWSPDSRSIAFVRIPPDTSGIDFKPRRTAEPWSIHVVDVTTGKGAEIWRAKPGVGSVFHPDEAETQLFWRGDRIVFPWEGSGWLHLYAVAAHGGNALELTPGELEVGPVTAAKDADTLIYASNQDDIDRRHLWEVHASGGEPKQLTKGTAIEVAPVVLSDGSIAMLHSDARMPMRPAVLASSGETHDVAPQLIPKSFPTAKLVEPQQVIFPAADGLAIHGQLFLPANAGAGKHPAVVFFHGGSRRQMFLGWHSMQYYSNAYGMNQYLASLGYVVLSVNYRSGIGYGLNFREALNYGAAGSSEFNDVQGAGLYLKSRGDVDGSHIGVWGGSYGGYLTALALARASDMFAAGVDLHGVHDWNLELGNWQPNYNPESDPNGARVAWESSPLASIKTWRSPVLLIQGDDDRNVQFANTVRLAEALREHDVPFEEHVFPDEIHDFLLHRSWIEAYTLGADFFNRHLKQ